MQHVPRLLLEILSTFGIMAIRARHALNATASFPGNHEGMRLVVVLLWGDKGSHRAPYKSSIPLERLYFAHLLASSSPLDFPLSRTLPHAEMSSSSHSSFLSPQVIGSSSLSAEVEAVGSSHRGMSLDSPEVGEVSSSSGGMCPGDVKAFRALEPLLRAPLLGRLPLRAPLLGRPSRKKAGAPRKVLGKAVSRPRELCYGPFVCQGPKVCLSSLLFEEVEVCLYPFFRCSLVEVFSLKHRKDHLGRCITLNARLKGDSPVVIFDVIRDAYRMLESSSTYVPRALITLLLRPSSIAQFVTSDKPLV
ncbi:hypothetical protein GW17_00043209 [Ensete ventricosum]|nr:hypothetical protein GW17_00043209 [Ensete ventricosum]